MIVLVCGDRRRSVASQKRAAGSIFECRKTGSVAVSCRYVGDELMQLLTTTEHDDVTDDSIRVHVQYIMIRSILEDVQKIKQQQETLPNEIHEKLFAQEVKMANDYAENFQCDY